jgi:hypothetical protein
LKGVEVQLRGFKPVHFLYFIFLMSWCERQEKRIMSWYFLTCCLCLFFTDSLCLLPHHSLRSPVFVFIATL